MVTRFSCTVAVAVGESALEYKTKNVPQTKLVRTFAESMDRI